MPKRAAFVTIISVEPDNGIEWRAKSWLMLARNCDLCSLATSSWRLFSSISVKQVAFWIANTDCAPKVSNKSIVLSEIRLVPLRRTTSAPTIRSAAAADRQKGAEAGALNDIENE